VKLLIAGRTGRMGQEIESIANEFGLNVIGGLDRKSGSLAEWLKSREMSMKPDHVSNILPDVVIDFTLPAATVELAASCALNKIPLVCGVTGLGEVEKAALKKAATEIPVLYSANMSIGIQILAKALDALKGADGFDLSIEEIHHRRKKDRPSGTALLIDAELKERAGRKADEIVSLRGGGVIGVHRVLAMSESETLIFEHAALNRLVFARGACRAARWLVGREPGFHSLRDIL
jgi:4-hydroxy-tetrahydrodipicolinate reductase